MIKFTILLLCLFVSAHASDDLAVEDDHAVHQILAEELDSELEEVAHEENGLDAQENEELDGVRQTEVDTTENDNEGTESDDDEDMMNDTEGDIEVEDTERQRRRSSRRGSRRAISRDRRPGRLGVNENRGDRLSPASNDKFRGHRASIRDGERRGRWSRRGDVSPVETESEEPSISELVLVVGEETPVEERELIGEEERHRGRGRRGGRGPGRRPGIKCRKHRRRVEADQEPEVPPRPCIGEGCVRVPPQEPVEVAVEVEVEVATQRPEIVEAAVSTPSSLWWWWSS